MVYIDAKQQSLTRLDCRIQVLKLIALLSVINCIYIASNLISE